MKISDFKPGLEFRHAGKTWRCTDVGARTAAAICTSEVWVTRAAANTGKKERVRLTTIEPKRLEGPPYGVPEQVIDERMMSSCFTLEEWQAAKRMLGVA